MIVKKLSRKNRNERFSERHFQFLGSHFVASSGEHDEHNQQRIVLIIVAGSHSPKFLKNDQNWDLQRDVLLSRCNFWNYLILQLKIPYSAQKAARE